MPALIVIAGLVALGAFLKMHPKDQDKVIGVNKDSNQ